MTPGPAAGPAGYLDLPVRGYLDELGRGTAAPGGGSAAALAVALAGGLCAMAARLSARQLPGDAADRLAAQADRLCAGAAALVQADADAYLACIEARREAGAEAAAAALSAAADVPMQVLAAGADLADIAARLAAGGNPNLRGDAIAAALLAEAGARAAAQLVRINLAAAPGDERLARAGRLLQQAGQSARAAQPPADPGRAWLCCSCATPGRYRVPAA